MKTSKWANGVPKKLKKEATLRSHKTLSLSLNGRHKIIIMMSVKQLNEPDMARGMQIVSSHRLFRVSDPGATMLFGWFVVLYSSDTPWSDASVRSDDIFYCQIQDIMGFDAARQITCQEQFHFTMSFSIAYQAYKKLSFTRSQAYIQIDSLVPMNTIRSTTVVLLPSKHDFYTINSIPFEP